jgi:glycosyltransferase involved in cell wall biosynthesis
VLIYRPKRPGIFSIEELFHTIGRELSRYVEVIEFEASSRWGVFADAWRLRKLKADIFHITGDVNYFACLLPRRATVLTIHDIGHFLYDLRGIRRWFYGLIWFALPLRAAGTIIAVSTATRNDLLRYFGISAKRTQVIPNCYNEKFEAEIKPFRKQCPLILQVGTGQNKNVLRLIEALDGISCTLVLIGRLSSDVTQKLAFHHVQFVNLFDLSLDEIIRQYKECDLVAFPSLNEGFGLPILEAQASGRPLITSNIPPLCDIAGDGACKVDPLDVAQIRNGILKIINDADYRQEIVRKGLLNVTRFEPSIVAEQYRASYSAALKDVR